MNNNKFSGITEACKKYSSICKHKCCQQDPINVRNIKPENYLLIYPGEIGKPYNNKYKHIIIVSDNFNGGWLGFCDAKKINQSKCNMCQNYKTLDCRSYPFAPAFIDEVLVLIADTRCPIIQNKEINKKEIEVLYKKTLSAWKKVVCKDEKIVKWIKTLNLNNYELY